MRISDWSSDVCSSDLASFLLPEPIRPRLLRESNIDFKAETQEGEVSSRHRKRSMEALQRGRKLMLQLGAEKRARGCDYHLMWIRSEEHTSALQSLMRISYAVFCLKKKTHTHIKTLSKRA